MFRKFSSRYSPLCSFVTDIPWYFWLFILCREVWPGVQLFLCLWHVRRAWQKQACAKINDLSTRAQILRSLGDLMYLSETPHDTNPPPCQPESQPRWTLLGWANECYEYLKSSIPSARSFWVYFDKEWIPKMNMWVTGNRNIPHAGQDTTAAIESYHSNMKATLKQSRSKLVGRRVDWLIHQLTGDVINRYDYTYFRKKNGFVTNKKSRALMVSALVQAQTIPDTNVQLSLDLGGPAYVRSSKRPHLRYAVYNPCTEWAICECVHSQRGNICKHQLKVLRMVRPDLAEGNIARYLGTLRGTSHSGLHQLLFGDTIPPRVNNTEMPAEIQVSSPPKPELGEQFKDDIDEMHQLILKVVERAYTYPIVRNHFIAELRATDTRHASIAVAIEGGTLHPMERETTPFCPVDDGTGQRLTRLKDFLDSRGYRTRKNRPCPLV